MLPHSNSLATVASVIVFLSAWFARYANQFKQGTHFHKQSKRTEQVNCNVPIVAS
jgi:hypothetical protein